MVLFARHRTGQVIDCWQDRVSHLPEMGLEEWCEDMCESLRSYVEDAISILWPGVHRSLMHLLWGLVVGDFCEILLPEVTGVQKKWRKVSWVTMDFIVWLLAEEILGICATGKRCAFCRCCVNNWESI